MEKKTHRLVKAPRMSVRSLADYMAASEITKRSVVRASKYRATARVIQHEEAKLALTGFISAGASDPNYLIAKADYIRGKLADSDFEAELNEHNADYLTRFASVCDGLALPKAEVLPGKEYPALMINDVQVTCSPPLRLQRTTRTNKVRSGAVMYRYTRGKALPERTACFQSAAIMGFLAEAEKGADVEPERALCLTIDAYAGKAHSAPGDAVSIFNNMKAACATIADRWDNIDPPANAVI